MNGKSKKLEPDLAQSLPLLAKKTAIQYIETLGENPLIHISLQGKTLARGGRAEQMKETCLSASMAKTVIILSV